MKGIIELTKAVSWSEPKRGKKVMLATDKIQYIEQNDGLTEITLIGTTLRVMESPEQIYNILLHNGRCNY